MKKGLALAFAVLMVMMVSSVVFAGPYFTVSNTGYTLALTGKVGCDYSFALQIEPVVKIFLDTHWLAPDNDFIASVGAGVGGFRADLKTVLDWKQTNINKFKGWDTSLTLTGQVFTGLKTWLGLSFNFDPTAKGTKKDPYWTLVPVFGLEGRW